MYLQSCQCRLVPSVVCIASGDSCPVNNVLSHAVYRATVTTGNADNTRHYIGMTASTFKGRYRNHTKSFNHKRYSNDTELSKHIWQSKTTTKIST